MNFGPQQTAEQIAAYRQMLVNEAIQTAQQVQQGAIDVQSQSRMVDMTAPRTQPPRTTVTGPFTTNNLFWFGLGSVVALGLSYYLLKRGR